ncbi:RER1 retention in endoplasmic reticulum 1 [Echinococcus multilocularis]|uniref:Protein RER1 n=1 Tax=Echinococcus multilocularis TaxID=6211 RepID=A0A087VY59_ECHMU|nr:RER1 retention in endoplasmic reticulum 1 [Echinococcus multilocularis]
MERYMRDDSGGDETSELNRLSKLFRGFFDRIVPYTLFRWLFFFGVLAFYVIRVAYLQGFFVVSYALAIFILSQFLGFLTPQFQFNDENSDPLLPTNSDGEFRPFMRRLSEFKFWRHCTIATIISIFCTFFSFFDLPVFWPILLIYFLTLFYVTMRRQVEHMIHYKYLPFTYGKPRPQGRSPPQSI